MLKKIIGALCIALCFYACKPLNPSIMFEAPKGYEFDKLVKDTTLEYIIAPNDILSFRLFTNNGFRLIDVTNQNQQQVQQLNIGITYLVEFDGAVNLPVIGRVNIEGLTIREAELFLEEKYSEIFIDPFLLINIANRRVTVFPGTGGAGTVITLANNNVKLLEALALAGGISSSGRAGRIRLIRGDLSNPTVYNIDLTTIDGISKADIILQANDIIYVEPIGITTRQVLGEIAPIFSFVTSLITLYFVIDRLD